MARVESVLAGIVAVVAACGDATGEGGAPPLNLLLLAGDIGGAGNVDGTGAAARFNQPSGVAVDSAGNVYVADYLNSTIRKVTPTGLVTTLAGTAGMVGSADGPGAAARFSQPAGVAVDSVGNVYVADQSNHTIRKVTAAGVVTTLAGTAGVVGSVDGPGAAARFYYPTSVAVDSSDNVYVADQSNSTIRKVSVTGTVMTLAGSAGRYGSADGTGAAASFNLPGGVAVDGAGNVYVADSINNTVRKVTAAGVVTTLAGAAGTAGSADGKGAAARFNQPAGVAVDRAGNIYVADQGNATVRKATADGVVTTLAGAAGVPGSVDGTGAAARFHFPAGVAVDSAGNAYVADPFNETLRKITPAGVVTTLAGTPGMSGSADGTGPAARFSGPAGVAVDSTGNVYVADQLNGTLRKVTAAGVVTTLAGTAGTTGSADGAGPAARFNVPSGVAVDGAGNVYVDDRRHDSFGTTLRTLRKVTAAGVVTTLAGDLRPIERSDAPTGVAVDSAGNVYVTAEELLLKVNARGVVTLLVGSPGMPGSADGTGSAAGFGNLIDAAVDRAGNVYVADQDNHTLRKVTPAGV
ncbi:MAG TPA: hypothetical protein VHT91_11135, partial [Kofleriaceae bacterium]|nr:hypothetical protein [Kofleriaceae bacterium]